MFIETFRRSNGRSERSIAVENLLASHGFYPYFFDISSRKLTQITSLYEGGQDTIYLRDSEENLKLIRESEPIKKFILKLAIALRGMSYLFKFILSSFVLSLLFKYKNS